MCSMRLKHKLFFKYLSVSESNMDYLFWFVESRMRLIPKPGVF